MAKDTQLAAGVINQQADALARRLDNGYLRLYDGVKPATADTALSGNNLLAELRFADPCAPAAVNGILTFNTIAPVTASAGGTPSFYRALNSDGATAVLDGTVGLEGSGCNLEFDTLPLAAGGTVTITSFTHAVTASATGY